jgi:predicted N-acetyltransferase YhbS
MDDQLTVAVTRYADLSPEDLATIDTLSSGEIDPRFEGFVWTPAEWQVVGRLGGRAVCGVKIAVRDVTVGGRQVRVGGIGDVATAPEWRRRGFAGAAMRLAGEFLCRELGAEFGLLFCEPSLVPYYSRFGWQRVAAPTMVTIPRGKVPFPDETMVLPCRGDQWPGGPTDLNGPPW